MQTFEHSFLGAIQFSILAGVTGPKIFFENDDFFFGKSFENFPKILVHCATRRFWERKEGWKQRRGYDIGASFVSRIHNLCQACRKPKEAER